MLQRGRRSNRVYAIKQVIALVERGSFLIDVSFVKSSDEEITFSQNNFRSQYNLPRVESAKMPLQY
jgi:hypothetical protein